MAVPNAAASAGFSDASDAGVHQATVESLTRQGIVRGTECAPGLLCPRDPLPRWAMAVWLVRVLDETDPARTADSGFVDVDAAEWWAPHVRRLAELGVTKGCATEPARYCPNKSVTRAQMASFLTRAFDLAPGPSTGFQDVSPSSTHADAINALAAAGITKGCTAEPARYCPQRPVTRAQMATFLYRAVAREPRIAFVSDMDQDAETLGEGRAVCPAWSPDGTHIAFAGRPGGESGDLEIWVMDADGASITQLTDNLDSEGCPLWSPDGTRLLYTIYRDLDDLFPASEIWVMHADGTGQRMLAERGESPAWSPNGSRIAYVSDRDGDREIFVMQADGTNQTQLTFNNDEDLAPVWSPLPKG